MTIAADLTIVEDLLIAAATYAAAAAAHEDAWDRRYGSDGTERTYEEAEQALADAEGDLRDAARLCTDAEDDLKHAARLCTAETLAAAAAFTRGQGQA